MPLTEKNTSLLYRDINLPLFHILYWVTIITQCVTFHVTLSGCLHLNSRHILRFPEMGASITSLGALRSCSSACTVTEISGSD